MKKLSYSLFVLGVLFLSANALAQTVTNTTHSGTGPYSTIQAAINNPATLSGDVITITAGTYNENVVVNKSVTIIGVGTTSVIQPTSGIGITVSANNITLQNLKVTGATDHGIWANNVSGLTITNVTADLNGTAGGRSGIALRAVTGTSILTNVTATNNLGHGVEIGNGSLNVQVIGGTFTGNGTAGNTSFGGGIMIYADASQSTNGTWIKGTINASSNKTAGIYLFCNPSGHINNTTIGATGAITLDDNGSAGGLGTGGAAILLLGPCDQTIITANSTNHGLVVPTAGLVVLGTDASGSHSPTNTFAGNCTLTGFTATSPAATMKATSGANTFICTNDVDATNNNLINGAATGFDVEDVLVHKVDNIAYGFFRGPGTELYVTPNSGSIQRAITIANNPYSITKIHVKSGTYNEAVTVNKSLYILGEGGTQPIVTPSAGNIGINVSANGVTIDNLEVTGATGGLTKHGIWANGVNGLTIQNVNAHANTGSGIALRGIPASPVSTVKNVTASNNLNQGLEIGNGSDGVIVDGGTFNSNGTNDNLTTGGGIMLYADVSTTVENIVIKGVITANTNTTAGIYIYSSPGIIERTQIGQAIGSNITLTNNGSNAASYGIGGAGVLVFGPANNTYITANFTMSTVNGAGLVVLGTNNAGLNSPDGVSVRNSVFTGYTPSLPAITLRTNSSPDYIANTAVDAFTGNTFGDATSYSAIENLIYDNNDNPSCGIIGIANNVSVNTPKDVEVSIETYLSLTSSVDLTGINVAVANLINATNTTTTGTMVTGVSVEIPESEGTVANEALEITFSLPPSGFVEFKYKIQDRNNFHDNTRVQHFHNGEWVDLGRIIRYEYDLSAGGGGSRVNITDVPLTGVSAIYAIFSTNSASTFAFVTPSGTSPLKYLTPTNAFQSAAVNAAYPSSLVVTVVDGAGAPVSGVLVTFTRPSSGASLTFTSGSPTGNIATATTNASGIAFVTATANGITGSFNVTADVPSSSSSITFSLTNNAFTGLLVKAKVFLQGPYSGAGLMTTSLAAASYIPLAQPYNSTPFNYAGTEAVANAPFLVTNNIVDWVLVELRTGLTAASKVDTRAALLKNDGTLLDVDGSTGVLFTVAGTGSYYIVIKHRNHFGIISASTVALPNASAYDFTTAQAQADGTNPMVALSDGPFGMYSGDANKDAIITAGDMSLAISALNNTGYNLTDVNFDGLVTAADISIMINNLNKTAQLQY